MPSEKRKRILVFLILTCSVCSLVFCCGSVEQHQNSTVIEPENISSKYQMGQPVTSSPSLVQKTLIFVPKADYYSGERIDISGSTPVPAGTHLVVALYRDWHVKAIPDGKSRGWEEDVVVQNSTSDTDRNFFVSFDSASLLPGDYYIVVSNLEAGPDEEVVLNRTASPITIKKGIITTQSGIPPAFSVMMIVIAFFSYRFGKTTKSAD